MNFLEACYSIIVKHMREKNHPLSREILIEKSLK